MLDIKLIEEIEIKTREILEINLGPIDQIEPPISLAKILDYYKLSLHEAKFTQDNIAGIYDKQSHTIFFSEKDPFKRQLFTVAHELGHIILHNKKSDVFYRHQAQEFNAEDSSDEKEANWFAASLLMPKELVKKFWDKNKDLHLLSLRFGVSEATAYWRLRNLNL